MPKSSVTVSLRSKGIPAFQLTAALNVHAQLLQLLTELTDIPAAALITVLNFSWTAWLSVVILILVAGIKSSASADTGEPDSLVFFPLFAFVFLPLLLLIVLVIKRRDAAQAALGRFRVQYVAIKLQAAALSGSPDKKDSAPSERRSAFKQHHTLDVKAGQTDASAGDLLTAGLRLPPVVGSAPAAALPGVAAAAEDVQKVLVLLTADLHQYLAHKRPYARHFFLPYNPDRIRAASLYKTTRQLGELTLRVQRSVREAIVHVGCLREALVGQDGGTAPGASPSTATLLGQQVSALHEAVEQLMTVKELHTPVLLRASVRWTVVIFTPIFMGWYWEGTMRRVNDAVGSIMGIVCHMALMALLDVAISLEDPFDEAALDAVSCLEALDSTRVMSTTSDSDRAAWLNRRDEVMEEEEEEEQGQQAQEGATPPSGADKQRGKAASKKRRSAPTAGLDVDSMQPAMPPPPPPLTQADTGTVLSGRL